MSTRSDICWCFAKHGRFEPILRSLQFCKVPLPWEFSYHDCPAKDISWLSLRFPPVSLTPVSFSKHTCSYAADCKCTGTRMHSMDLSRCKAGFHMPFWMRAVHHTRLKSCFALVIENRFLPIRYEPMRPQGQIQ